MAVSPLFAEDIGWVVSALDMVELGDGRGDAFTDLVERQGVVALVEACMGNGGAIHHVREANFELWSQFKGRS